MAKWDEYTMQDRLDEVAKSDNPLTIEEEAWVSSWIVVSVGNEAKRAGFLDMLRWYHMGGKSYPLGMKTLVGYKLQDGQSHLARNIFEEAVETGNVEYALSTPINNITTKPEGVTIVTSEGQTFQAKRSICTIPLNVLKDITVSSL